MFRTSPRAPRQSSTAAIFAASVIVSGHAEGAPCIDAVLKSSNAATDWRGTASRSPGYKIYQPLLREPRRSHGRKIIATPPLFPGYLFVWVVRGWWDARWAAGVRRLIMDGLVPAHVPDAVIDEIRSRERGGYVELLKPRGFRPGMRVRVIDGPLREQIGMLAALRPHERVLVLL